MAFFVTPLLLLLWVSLQTDAGTTLGATRTRPFPDRPLQPSVLGSTLWLGVEVTLVCLVLGHPLVWPMCAAAPLQMVSFSSCCCPKRTSVGPDVRLTSFSGGRASQ
jgi:putative spermidine/putrescine transport system permease protein